MQLRAYLLLVVAAFVLFGTALPAEAAGDVLNGAGGAASQSSSAPSVPDQAVPEAVGRQRITFDDFPAPCVFFETNPLRDEYAAMGVHFRGPGAGLGGAILDQCGNFGVGARSGRQFLAFSGGTYAVTPEIVRFDGLQRTVVLRAADGFGGIARFTLVGIRDGVEVARTTARTTIDGYVELKVTSADGIKAVRLAADTEGDNFVVDDLAFEPL